MVWWSLGRIVLQSKRKKLVQVGDVGEFPESGLVQNEWENEMLRVSGRERRGGIKTKLSFRGVAYWMQFHPVQCVVVKYSRVGI